jgi:hypothetical protein
VKMPPSPEELELDSKIRQWPRTPERGPYQSGLEAVTGAVNTYTSGLLVPPVRASLPAQDCGPLNLSLTSVPNCPKQSSPA